MDVAEFTRLVPPRKKVSRLNPFISDIADLKGRGYTDQQIREWLAANQVQVSRESVRKFIKNHITNTPKDKANTPLIPPPEVKHSLPADTMSGSHADRLRKKVEQQKQDAASAKFRHDKTGNLS